nr:uncharacterized protein LOC115257245 [Aedes albopictus]
MAHKLTESDVDFENCKTSKVDKMKVSNSTKYCNHSVAAALMVLSETDGRQHVKSSSVFLEDLSRWFDFMSSRSIEDALSLTDPKYDEKINHLKMMVRLVTEIKVGSDGHWKPWQAAIIMATNAILRLQRRLLVDSGYPVLYTSRFTQDCIENLFSIIRSKQRRPTPLQFKSHLRTVTLSQYIMSSSSTSVVRSEALRNTPQHDATKRKRDVLEESNELNVLGFSIASYAKGDITSIKLICHKPGEAAHTGSRARHSYQRSGRPTAAVLYSHRWKDSRSTPPAAAHTATASSMTPTTALVTVTSVGSLSKDHGLAPNS